MGKDGSGEPSFMVKLLYKYAVEAAGVSLHGAKGGVSTVSLGAKDEGTALNACNESLESLVVSEYGSSSVLILNVGVSTGLHDVNVLLCSAYGAVEVEAAGGLLNENVS